VTTVGDTRTPRISARIVQIGLGGLWLLDGLLQLQPKMFGTAFANNIILPSAQGQPGLLSGAVTHMAHLISVQPVVVNAVFASVQILIGVGLLLRETVKPALAISIAWALGVWAFGEGFGMILTGSASPLTGAPGAALLYAAVSLLVWPSARTSAPEDTRAPAAADGRWGAGGGQSVWAALWVGMGVLWLLPANRTPGSVADAIQGAASGEPGWFSHLEMAASNLFAGWGSSTAIIAAVVSIVIGLGPLLTKYSWPFLVAGMALALDYWVFGQAFGQMLTGAGTDPSTGPLIILLALALFPNATRPTLGLANPAARAQRPPPSLPVQPAWAPPADTRIPVH
jgi:hypothetical protein